MSEYFIFERRQDVPFAVILIKNIVILFLTAVQFAMLARAILFS